MNNKNIFNHIKKHAKKSGYLCLLTMTLGIVSCDNYLTLYPEDDIVDEEYWDNGDKVQSVVASCYRYTCDNNVLRKILYWGEIRSDNVEKSNIGTEEEQLTESAILSSNSIVKWDGFYKVINICNNVIEKAPAVRSADPNFTEEKFHNYMAEAYTIRAMMYFWLVRSFGDVPYITEPSDSEQKDYLVSQTLGDEIIRRLISDMETYGLPWAANDWATPEYTHGRITKNAVRAFLADLYLWKASDAGNSTADVDYQKCVDYCNSILNDPSSTLTFCEADNMYSEVFYAGNATENIFELNFVNNGLSNSATAVLYGNTNKSTTAHFNPTASLYNLYGANDQRRYQYLMLTYTGQGGNVSVSNYKVFKYEGMRPATGFGETAYTYRSSTSYANWIIYRLAEVYLMKAEALAILARRSSDTTKADEAIAMCNVLYERANGNNESLTYSQISDVEEIVLEERRRELCFEGKRWYDLLRKVRRDGNTANALQHILNARSDDATLLKSRLSTMAAWYLPISATEMNANPNLHQNDYYKLTEN